MTEIRISIDEQVEKKAKQILDDIGLDMQAAINIYLKRIIRE